MMRISTYEEEILSSIKERAERTGVGLHFEEKENEMKIYLVAKDWAGLVDTVTGAIHRWEFNIKFLMGSVMEKDFASLILVIGFESDAEREKFNKLLPDIKTQLREVANFEPAMMELLRSGIIKIEKFKSVLHILSRSTRKRKEREGVIKEAEKFFSSRSWAYIEERKPEDLSQNILTSYFLQKEAKRTGEIQVHISNFKTPREHLTGIIVAGWDRVLYLDHLLDVLREFLPNFKRKFDKQFTTEEGITVIRLEITDENEQPISLEKHLLLENYIRSHIKRAHRTLVRERVRISPEMTGRVLVPRLLEETRKTGISHVYILPTGTSPENFSFKIIGVGKCGNSRASYEKILIDAFTNARGISIVSLKTPSRYDDLEIDMVDINANRENFDTEEKVYLEIKRILKDVYTHCRDFDEGMRTLEIDKLNELVQILSGQGIEQHYIKKLFYSLDEFYRVNALTEDLSLAFSFLWKLINQSIQKGGGILLERKQGKKCSFLAIAGRGADKIFKRFLEEIKEVESNILSFDELGIPSYLIFLTRKRAPLKDKELKKIFEELKISL